MRRQIVIGNWKSHGSHEFTGQLLRELLRGWVGLHQAEVVVCPAHVHLAQAYRLLAYANIGLGAQDVSHFPEGAYTGEVSAKMLHDLGCHYVIVGHSERRRYHREKDDLVAKKFEAALTDGLIPVLCVGESSEQHERGETMNVVGQQVQAVIDHCGMENFSKGIVAYEPLWAIGTGRNATPDQAQEIIQALRDSLGDTGSKVRLLYGGSVTAINASDFFAQPAVDGLLVGGASLNGRDFLQICRAAELG